MVPSKPVREAKSMSYRTILVHCNDRRRIETLLAPAVSLAEQFQAHLIGLSVAPSVAVIAVSPAVGPPIVLDEHCKQYREDNPAMRSAFEAATRGHAIVSEWRDDEADAHVADRVLRYARAADLVVAAQPDPQWPNTQWLDVSDRLAMESGRPVLIVPNAGAHAGIGGKVLIAWNGRREAARAVFDALPILERAKEVKVVWVDSQSERELSQDIAVADICATLTRDGVNCQATKQQELRAGVGETLLACAKDMSADLLVMGCYGHTRLREFVFGGASRYVFAHMSLPVLMSH
jgi:nucleotide-binding universal stress UspA family protein